jgi:hypothetical protein
MEQAIINFITWYGCTSIAICVICWAANFEMIFTATWASIFRGMLGALVWPALIWMWARGEL